MKGSLSYTSMNYLLANLNRDVYVDRWYEDEDLDVTINFYDYLASQTSFDLTVDLFPERSNRDIRNSLLYLKSYHDGSIYKDIESYKESAHRMYQVFLRDMVYLLIKLNFVGREGSVNLMPSVPRNIHMAMERKGMTGTLTDVMALTDTLQQSEVTLQKEVLKLMDTYQGMLPAEVRLHETLTDFPQYSPRMKTIFSKAVLYHNVMLDDKVYVLDERSDVDGE